MTAAHVHGLMADLLAFRKRQAALCPACGRDWGGPCPVCPREDKCAGETDGGEHAPILFWCSPGEALVCPVCESGDVTFERVPAAPANKENQ